MPTITLTAEEEIQYLRELDQIQEMMPDLEIQVVSAATPATRQVLNNSSMGEEFRAFLRSQIDAGTGAAQHTAA